LNGSSWLFQRLPLPDQSRETGRMDDELISREELTATLFSIADIREDVRMIRKALEEDDGEAQEDDS
jgi:hypothetical protein